MLQEPQRAVVTPIGNERDRIDQAVAQMAPVAAGYAADGFAWLVVFTDYGTDGTEEHLRRIAARKGYEWLRVVRLHGTASLAKAYAVGYQEALALGCVKIAEADIGHPFDRVPDLFDALEHVPAVFGTRYGRGASYSGPWTRRLLSRAGTCAGRILLGLRMSDGTSGFQGFRRDCLLKIPFAELWSTGHFVQTEIKRHCARLPFREVSIHYRSCESALAWRSLGEAIWLLFPLAAVSPIDPERV